MAGTVAEEGAWVSFAAAVCSVNAPSISIYTDNHWFGCKAEAKIFKFPTMFGGCFLACFKLVFAPMLIPNVLIEHYHRSRNNLFGKKFQNSFAGVVDITINVHEVDWLRVFCTNPGSVSSNQPLRRVTFTNFRYREYLLLKGIIRVDGVSHQFPREFKI